MAIRNDIELGGVKKLSEQARPSYGVAFAEVYEVP